MQARAPDKLGAVIDGRFNAGGWLDDPADDDRKTIGNIQSGLLS
jgi:hypothetical protein